MRENTALQQCALGAWVVLQLEVRNHPGVMSQVCNLFSRRGFNMEGIVCMPLPDCIHSRIWLLVNDDQRLPQVIAQLKKLHDVLAVNTHDGGHRVFASLQEFFL